TGEQILEAEEGRRLVYAVIKGMPARNYRAEVTLTPAAGGTHVRWAATWDATPGGRIVLRTLRKLYPQIVADLVTAAEKQTSDPVAGQRYLGGTCTAIPPPSWTPGVRPRRSALQKRPASYQFGCCPLGSSPMAW